MAHTAMEGPARLGYRARIATTGYGWRFAAEAETQDDEGHRGMTRRLGLVLAGGGSTRFGSDKAGALLRGKRLIDHAADSLRPWCETVMLVGRAGRHFAAANGFDQLVSVGCWRADLAGDLDAFLAEPVKHAVRAWIARADVEAIEADAILNINRREDLIAAEAAGR